MIYLCTMYMSMMVIYMLCIYVYKYLWRWDRISLWSAACSVGSLADQWAPGSACLFSISAWMTGGCYCAWLLDSCWKSELRPSCSHSKHFTSWAIFPIKAWTLNTFKAYSFFIQWITDLIDTCISIPLTVNYTLCIWIVLRYLRYRLWSYEEVFCLSEIIIH